MVFLMLVILKDDYDYGELYSTQIDVFKIKNIAVCESPQNVTGSGFAVFRSATI